MIKPKEKADKIASTHFKNQKEPVGESWELVLISGCSWLCCLPVCFLPRGGMTLGMMGGIGLVVFVFGFGLTPGKPPVDVILTIMAVVCASSCPQAAGGLDCLLQIAEKALRRHPRAVCYLAPYPGGASGASASFGSFTHLPPSFCFCSPERPHRHTASAAARRSPSPRRCPGLYRPERSGHRN